MAAKKGKDLADRRFQKAERHRKREPLQDTGMPQGKHRAGFKGTKVDIPCQCGRCHPNANPNRERIIIL